MKEELNLYEILKSAPMGIRLYTPKFGWLYLYTASRDDYRNGWLGNDKAIKLTKKKPGFQRNSHNIDYHYDDIYCCFDEYGHYYPTDPHGFNPKPDEVFLDKEETYRYNGRKFHTTECRVFPDDELTWDNWQTKLFMPGDMVVVPIHDKAESPWDKDAPPPIDYNFTGYVKDITPDGGMTLTDIIKETIKNRIHSHDYLDHPVYFYPDQTKQSRFAGHQDRMEWYSNKRIIEEINNGTYQPPRSPWDICAGYYGSLKENRL